MKYVTIAGLPKEDMSPSMRREWIEILCLLNRLIHPESPSMRREWIEIAIMPIVLLAEMVSLHAEGVD